jgi:hypothetical protein
MRPVQRLGEYSDIVDAPSLTDPTSTIKLGVRPATFGQYADRGLNTSIAQYYGIVQGGLVSARHAFRGLNRPLALGNDMDADQSVVVYTWRSQNDYEWLGDRFNGNPVAMVPPQGRVFVVLVREVVVEGICGSIERWNWIREDPGLPHAPVDWRLRYGEKLWSRDL